MPWFQFQEKIVTFGDEWESPVHPLFPKVLGRTKKKVCIIFSRLLILRFPHKDTVCKQIPHYRKVLGSVRRIFSSSASYNLKACISHTHTKKRGGGGEQNPLILRLAMTESGILSSMHWQRILLGSCLACCAQAETGIRVLMLQGLIYWWCFSLSALYLRCRLP